MTDCIECAEELLWN